MPLTVSPKLMVHKISQYSPSTFDVGMHHLHALYSTFRSTLPRCLLIHIPVYALNSC